MKTGLWLSRRHVRWTIVLLALLPILPTILMVQLMLESAGHERKLAVSELTDVYREQLISAVGRFEDMSDTEALPEGLRNIFKGEEVGLRVLDADGDAVLNLGPAIGTEAIQVKPREGAYRGWTVMLDVSGSLPDVVSDLERTTWWQAFWIVTGVITAAGGVWFVVHRGLRIDELRSDMVTTVSHEMKTPVASMKILLETLVDSDFLDEAGRREYLQLLTKENVRLERLAENFLTFSRLRKGEVRLKPRVVDVENCVAETIELYRPRFEELDGELLARVEPGLMFQVDRDAFSIVLGNLIENGLKYGGEIPRVVVSAGQFGKRSRDGRVEVVDNGKGILLKDRKAVFQKFFQGDHPLNQKNRGVGLGLSICRRLLRLMRGKIIVKTGQEGMGSAMVINLKGAVVSKCLDTGKTEVAERTEKGPVHAR